MLDDYTSVFFKPTNGSGGKNIIRIRKTDKGYQSQLNTTKTSTQVQLNCIVIWNALQGVGLICCKKEFA